MIAYGNHANHNIVKPIVCGVNWDSGTNGEAICQPLLFTNFSQLASFESDQGKVQFLLSVCGFIHGTFVVLLLFGPMTSYRLRHLLFHQLTPAGLHLEQPS